MDWTGSGGYIHYSDSLHLYCHDSDKIGIGQEQKFDNLDSLSWNKNESEKLFKEMYNRMICLNISIYDKEIYSFVHLKTEYIAYNHITILCY